MVQTKQLSTIRAKAPVTLFRGATGKKPFKVATFADLLEMIRQENQETAKMLQKLKQEDPEAYNREKKRLTAFASGKFSYASTEGLEEYSPLLFFDLDGLSSDLVRYFLHDCKQDSFIHVAFPSPSGEGLRIGVWTNATADSHKEAYQAICEHLSGVFRIPIGRPKDDRGEGFIDPTTSNISRIWFFTYVEPKNFYINPDSKVFKAAAPGGAPLPAAPTAKRPENQVKGKYKVEFSHREKVENLISSLERNGLDITQGVEAWFKIGCALVSEFGEDGRSMFHQVSRFHRAYSPEECDSEFNRCKVKQPKGGITLASFYELCKDHGVLVDYEALKALHRAPAAGRSAPPKIKTLKTPEIDVSKEITLPDGTPTNLTIEEGGYIWRGDRSEKPISNFLIDPLYLLKDSKNPKRIWRIKNRFGQEAMIYVPVRSITKPAELEAEIEGKGNFIPNWNKQQFNTLKEVLYSQEKEAQEIPLLGFQPETGLFAFCNGVIDGDSFVEINRFGIVETSKGVFYIPALSEVNKDDRGEYTNDRKFCFAPSALSLEGWSRLFCDVYGDNGKIALCFAVASLFRDVIFQHVNSFPILYLFGPRGTGKTTLRDALLSLFGIPQTPIALGSASSPKGFARKMGQYSNALISFEEYKNKIDSKLIEMLKGIYDGIGYERALMTNDNKTHSSPVLSSVLMGGQELPTKENALFSRVFILEFSRQSWDDKTKYDELTSWQEKGLGTVLFELLQDRPIIEKNFQAVFSEVLRSFKEDSRLQTISDRARSNASVILAPFKIIAGQRSFPFSFEEVLELVKRQMMEHEVIQARTTEVNQFWQVFNYLVSESKILSRDFKIDGNILYLAPSTVFPKYEEFAPKQGIQTVDRETLMKYLKQQPYFIKPKGQQGGRDQVKKRLGTSGEKSAWVLQFDYQMVSQFSEMDALGESTGNNEEDIF